MTTDEAVDIVHAAVARAAAAGLVVTGRLEFVRPLDRRVEVRAGRNRGSSLVQYWLWTEVISPPAPAGGGAVALATPAYVAKPAAGEVCLHCGGSNLRWAGACKVCGDCGTAGGCG